MYLSKPVFTISDRKFVVVMKVFVIFFPLFAEQFVEILFAFCYIFKYHYSNTWNIHMIYWVQTEVIFVFPIIFDIWLVFNSSFISMCGLGPQLPDCLGLSKEVQMHMRTSVVLSHSLIQYKAVHHQFTHIHLNMDMIKCQIHKISTLDYIDF